MVTLGGWVLGRTTKEVYRVLVSALFLTFDLGGYAGVFHYVSPSGTAMTYIAYVCYASI